MQIDHFVGDSSRPLDGDRRQRGVSPLRLELAQVGRRHLANLAGDLEQPVLVDRPIDLREILLGCNQRYLAFLSSLDDPSAGCVTCSG